MAASAGGDAVGIGLDHLCGVFQHQDTLIFVVNAKKFSIPLIMPRFTYNGLSTKTKWRCT